MSKFSRFVGKTGAFLKKNAPVILTAVSVGTGVAAFVIGCKETYKKAPAIMEQLAEDIQSAEKAKNYDGPIKINYTDKDYTRDCVLAYRDAALGFLKIYAPAIGLMTISIGCNLAGHKIMKTRNAALAAGLASLEEASRKYRQRVVDELGEEADTRFYTGLGEKTTATIEDVDKETGEIVTREVEVREGTPDNPRVYIFDETSRHYDPTSDEYNRSFLELLKPNLQRTLENRGYIYENDALRLMDIPEDEHGWENGLVYGMDETGCDLTKVLLDYHGFMKDMVIDGKKVSRPVYAVTFNFNENVRDFLFPKKEK